MSGFKSMHWGFPLFFVAVVGHIPCTEFPYIKITRVTHNNLGGHGPDSGDEGMKFSVDVNNVGLGSKTTAELRINADGNYVPTWNQCNGVNGEWARINFDAGKAAGFTASFWDPSSNSQLHVRRGYMTFSDLDGGPTGKEFVAVETASFSGNYFIGNQSKLTMETTSHANSFVQSQVPSTYGRTFIYTGTDVEYGHDNPALPDKFTESQKNNAVTLQIGHSGLNEVKFKLGATPGSSHRTIQFNFQPTLFCAITQMRNGSEKPPLDPSLQPKTNSGETLDESKFSEYEICHGSGCKIGA